MLTTSDLLQGGAAVKTLVLSDLVSSTRLVEKLGDRRTARLFARHDKLARELLAQHGGLEIDKADGFFLLFDRPLSAVSYALAYHEALTHLAEDMGVKLSARVGIHLGEVFLRANPPEYVERGAKPLEVEGLAKPITARMMSLAEANQTLLTRGAFELARRAAVDRTLLDKKVCWLSHGTYRIQGLRRPIRIFEVGVEGFAPLTPPHDTAKMRQAWGEATTPGQTRANPAISQPTRPSKAVKSAREEPQSGEIPALIAQISKAVETASERQTAARERSGERRRWWMAAVGAAIVLAAVLAFQEYRIAVATERAAEVRAGQTEELTRMLSDLFRRQIAAESELPESWRRTSPQDSPLWQTLDMPPGAEAPALLQGSEGFVLFYRLPSLCEDVEKPLEPSASDVH